MIQDLPQICCASESKVTGHIQEPIKLYGCKGQNNNIKIPTHNVFKAFPPLFVLIEQGFLH